MKNNNNVFAMSRVRFAHLLEELAPEQFEESAFISINEIDPLFVEFRPTSENYLNLRFQDVDEVDFDNFPFTEELAEKISEFVRNNAGKKAWFIHCTAGKCRSGAVAEVISEYFGIPYRDFKRDNGQVQPNILIKKLLTSSLLNTQINTQPQ